MAEEYAEISLESMMCGELNNRFKYEFGRMMENVADPNTTLAKRKLTIAIEVKPNKSRTQNDVKVDFKLALAPTERLETTVFVAMTKKGLVASEYNPKQQFLPEMKPETSVSVPVNPANTNVTPIRAAGGES